MSIRSIDDLQLTGKRVFVRVDFNVPLDEQRNVTDDTRIREALPTMRRVLAAWAASSSWPRTSGARRARTRSCRSSRRRARLSELLGQAVRGPARRRLRRRRRAEDGEGPDAHARWCCWRTSASTRRRRRTTRPSPGSWRRSRDVYVNDAFGTAHRAHASTAGMAPFVKERAAGLPDGEGARVPRPAAEGAGEALRGGARRREGLGQDRGDREPACREVERADRRRGDGLHLPQGAGRSRSARAASRTTSSTLARASARGGGAAGEGAGAARRPRRGTDADARRRRSAR